MTAFNIFIGVSTTIAVSVLMALGDSDDKIQNIYEILDNVFLIFPHYCLGRGLIQLSIDQAYVDAFASLGYDQPPVASELSWDKNGRACLAMFFESIVFFALVLFIQFDVFKSKTSNVKKSDAKSEKEYDNDVLDEANRALLPENTDLLKVQKLNKIFDGPKGEPLVAVDGVTFSVPEGECFGLLGVNGAGKTTTFKMLTTEITPTTGNAFIKNLSVISDAKEVRRRIGYCPQFDSLNLTLTAAEHLRYYGKLRGIDKDNIEGSVDWILSELDLEKYRDIPAEQYSGGYKRKLSTAIALTG